MQRWEYKVVSLEDGRYTEVLNEYGRDGWELVSVAPDVHENRPRPRKRSMPLPIPGALGRIEDAASKLNFGDSGGEEEAPPEGAVVTTLLWVLRRPLDDDENWD